MKPAPWPRSDADAERLLVIDAGTGGLADRRVGDLPALLAGDDLLVLNDAATLPASLFARTVTGAELELRLAGQDSGGWLAVVLGAGDFRTRTEDRPLPPPLVEGDTLVVSERGELPLAALVVAVVGDGLIRIRFDRRGPDLWQALYAHGHPIQYAYVESPLALWHVQSRFAGAPWSSEMPSAARPITWRTLFALLRRGVRIGRVTHAAGLSSTGRGELDQRLPLDERFWVPEETVHAIAETRGRVVAVGTTVVRALESAAESGALKAGAGIATLRIGANHTPRVVHAVMSGMHEPGTSHFELLSAFAPAPLLARASEHAAERGYLAHEFGDSCSILPARS